MKYFALIIFSLLFLAAIPAYAMTATTSAQELLDKVATKVAELSAKQRQIYVGTIKTVGTVSYTVTTIGGDKTVTTSEGTNFYRIRAGNRSDATFKTIKAGDDIGAVGTIDPQTGEMTAKQVIAKIQRQNIVGVIDLKNVDLTSAGTLKKVDSTGKISTAKLADFVQGNIAFVIAYASDNSGVLSALKAMVLLK